MIGRGRARMRLPEVDVAGVHLPELELVAEAPFVRRRRANPIWVAFKFVVGAGFGLFVGALLAALVAPAAGEDTRRRLREMVPYGDAVGSTRALGATAGSAVESMRGNAGDVVHSVRGRLRRAMEEAGLARDHKERELKAQLEVAQRSGEMPEPTA